ncbi:MAG: electron transfer flavoprotein subunit alpha/FixB family protein [Deltaproteobacteria bacterium]|nr:electron transfer flavoprotein subunit alpha/FixB family protein [Deltaproteobacteria bacterium]
MPENIIIICEQDETGIRPVTSDVIAFGGLLSKITGLPTAALVINSGLPEPDGCDRVIRVTVSGRPDFSPEMYISVLSDILPQLDPAYICIAHTMTGIDFAPGLAARFNGACITGIENAGEDDKGPWFGRQVLSGKKIARIRALKLPAFLTVSAGEFSEKAAVKKPPGPAIELTSEYLPVFSDFIEKIEAPAPAASLMDAESIIAAGNGIGKQENLSLINELAALFARSAVAGSRPVCDRGWLAYNRQVGETGATVRPRLYLACGISGSSQHIAGMRGSEFVVAINTDAKAPICRAADICVIEDLNVFVPELIRALKEQA